MAEQRYQAVLAVISDGVAIKVVAEAWGVSRQTLHAWLARLGHEVYSQVLGFTAAYDGLIDASRSHS